MSEGSRVYPHVIPDITEWPIYTLLADRKNFVEEIDDFTHRRLLKLHGDDLQDVIAKTIYMERIRIKEEPWKVDPPNERLFWKKISKRLLHATNQQHEEESRLTTESILKTIIHRYSEEIVGTFRKPTFLFARKFLTVFFNRLLNTAAGRNMKRIWGSKHKVYERLLTRGEVDKVRSLMTKGTVIIVPTHSSNLDSILIGYALDTIMGLPSFSYGAGLNLYNTGYTAYFMNRLGAYRVDRRKKNPIYLETLKGMSNLSIQRGTNSLFFPGGTRSRSGAIETKLKMGLLGTAVEAQRAIFQKGKNDKIFIVPLIISYHVVLEAKYLIEQHLRQIGRERYLRSRDEFYSLRKLLKFAWNFFSQPSEITLSFGKPLDVLGNFVDDEGNSFDRFGNPVHVRDYFLSSGAINEDLQRESEYTIMLADRIAERYLKENIVLTSHLVAFAAFSILQHENPKLDLFGVLRLPPEEFHFDLDLLKGVISQLRDHLIEESEAGRIKLASQIYFDEEILLKDGVRKLGVYHVEKPLLFNQKGELVSQDFKLLYFYHNRLVVYGLDKVIAWNKARHFAEEIEVMEEV
jgi:glycerol-3-phosphate O-acyltransferase